MDLLPDRGRGERLIADGRLFLAAFALLAQMLDPDLTALAPERLPHAFAAFAVYALALAILVRRFAMTSFRVRLTLHLIDFLIFSAFILLTHASVSPFFVFFIFSMVTALLRFGVPGMALTATGAIVAYLLMAITDDRIRADPGYLIMRSTSLALTSLLLTHLAAYHDRVRRELSKVAAWPRVPLVAREGSIAELLRAANDLLESRATLLVWEESEEPWSEFALLRDGSVETKREAPGLLDRLVSRQASEAGFAMTQASELALSPAADGRLTELKQPLLRAFEERFGSGTILSTPVNGETIRGRIFFFDPPSVRAPEFTLADIAARFTASTLEHLAAIARMRATAVADERLRVGRDLHDGVLQSLTGVALQLAMVRRTIETDPDGAQARLGALQELIATDQRELRSMVDQLRVRGPGGWPDIEQRLKDLAERFRKQWDVDVTIDVSHDGPPLGRGSAVEVYNLISEGVANAAKHAHARAIKVQLGVGARNVFIWISDDGRGFPFTGSYTLEELESMRRGPVTLKERISSLGGSLRLHSAADGSQLEIEVPRLTAETALP